MRRTTKLIQRGYPIPGSKLFRNFCKTCGEAMRVKEVSRYLINIECYDCKTVRNTGGGPATPKMTGLDGDPDAHNPSWKSG